MDLHEQLAAALSDRYRVERELGRSGMAVVFLAEDLKHRRRIAINLLQPGLSAILGSSRSSAKSRSPPPSGIPTSYRCTTRGRPAACSTT